MDAAPSLLSLLVERASAEPHDIALLAPGRPNGTYSDLAEQAADVGGALRGHGIAEDDRVALVVKNGAEAASAFLAISSAAVCAPLNPSYRAAELEFFLRDLQARAVVVGMDVGSPVRDVAGSLGVDVLELRVDPTTEAGRFVLDGLGGATAQLDPTADAEALVLHTSGTTARPKIVPLTHGQLLASARNVSMTLALQPTDRCLNVMPLFHIHGLVAGLLASLHAGASIVCTPGFHQVRFFDWLLTLNPTWTTAVPTMYQAILERAQKSPELVTGHGLRFARSSSAPLPTSVLEGIERALGVPLIEAYGMTEAAHQMTSNPLPPGVRKPGSVGLPAGPRIAILDPAGQTRLPGEVGEVAIQGESVFAGYAVPLGESCEPQSEGWFRTGDQGRLDDDGYLFLLGRLKEVINRAGEKISPLELDEVLLRHPGVAEAVAFGVPHARLGEEVAAAVVLRDESTADERELQDYVAQTVAPFKVPRRIVVVDEIPKGATGKVQRVSLADRLGLVMDGTPLASENTRSRFLEESLCEIWADVLAIPDVHPLDDFFALGGDSILGAEAVARVRDLVGRPDLPLVVIVRAPTPRAMAAEVELEFGWNRSGALLMSQGDERLSTIFLIHGVDGDVIRFAALARMLEPRVVYGLRAPQDVKSEYVEDLAARYLRDMRRLQPRGPYLIAPYCMGAAVALEIVHRLHREAETAALILIDPRLQRPRGLRYASWLFVRRARQRRLAGAVTRRLVGRGGTRGAALTDYGPIWNALETAREAYVCRPTYAPAVLVQSEDFARFDMPDWYLRDVFPCIVYQEDIRGEHVSLFSQPSVRSLHAVVERALDRLPPFSRFPRVE